MRLLNSISWYINSTVDMPMDRVIELMQILYEKASQIPNRKPIFLLERYPEPEFFVFLFMLFSSKQGSKKSNYIYCPHF
jgi:hypothetical protein